MSNGMSSIGMRVVASSAVRHLPRTQKLRRCGILALGTSHFVALPQSFALKDVRRERLDRHLIVNAAGDQNNDAFTKDDYIEAVIEHVTRKRDCGVVELKLKDGKDSILAMYIGEFETTALVSFLTKRRTLRPMTYELLYNTIRLLGYEVTSVNVTALVGSTYHARVLCRSMFGREEISMDARPSDAVNLAVRFNAPVLVHKDVAELMAISEEDAKLRSQINVPKICMEEIALHKDPTIILKLKLQLAIAEENYAAAAELRDQIDNLLTNDPVLHLVVALESALSGQRFVEAMQLYEELRSLRLKQESSEKQESHG